MMTDLQNTIFRYSSRPAGLANFINTWFQHRRLVLFLVPASRIIIFNELLLLHHPALAIRPLAGASLAPLTSPGCGALAAERRCGLDEVHAHEHTVAHVDCTATALTTQVPVQQEASLAERLDKRTNVGLVLLGFPGLVTIDVHREVGQVGGLLLLGGGGPGLLALRRPRGGGALLAVADAMGDDGPGGLGVVAWVGEAALDLSHPELAAPTQDTVGFFNKGQPVGAHQSEAEDGDIDGAVGQREIGDVGARHERGATRLEIEAADVEVELLGQWLKCRGELRVAAA